MTTTSCKSLLRPIRARQVESYRSRVSPTSACSIVFLVVTILGFDIVGFGFLSRHGVVRGTAFPGTTVFSAVNSWSEPTIFAIYPGRKGACLIWPPPNAAAQALHRGPPRNGANLFYLPAYRLRNIAMSGRAHVVAATFISRVGNGEVWLIDTSSGLARKLCRHEGLLTAAVSDDGRQVIVVGAYGDNSGSFCTVYAIDSNLNSKAATSREWPTLPQGDGVVFNHAGNEIALLAGAGDQRSVYAADTQDLAPRRIGDASLPACPPVFSADDRQIVYSRIFHNQRAYCIVELATGKSRICSSAAHALLSETTGQLQPQREVRSVTNGSVAALALPEHNGTGTTDLWFARLNDAGPPTFLTSGNGRAPFHNAYFQDLCLDASGQNLMVCGLENCETNVIYRVDLQHHQAVELLAKVPEDDLTVSQIVCSDR